MKVSAKNARKSKTPPISQGVNPMMQIEALRVTSQNQISTADIRLKCLELTNGDIHEAQKKYEWVVKGSSLLNVDQEESEEDQD